MEVLKQEGGLTVLREVKDGEVVSTTVRLTPEEVRDACAREGKGRGGKGGWRTKQQQQQQLLSPNDQTKPFHYDHSNIQTNAPAAPTELICRVDAPPQGGAGAGGGPRQHRPRLLLARLAARPHQRPPPEQALQAAEEVKAGMIGRGVCLRRIMGGVDLFGSMVQSVD